MEMVKSRFVPRTLRASSTARLDPPSLRTHGGQASRLLSVLEPRWWNELPLAVRTAGSLGVFKHRLKTRLCVKHFSMSAGLGLPGMSAGLGLPGISAGPLFGQCLSSWSTCWSSFLTSPMLLGAEVAKDRKLVRLTHSIPLWKTKTKKKTRMKKKRMMKEKKGVGGEGEEKGGKEGGDGGEGEEEGGKEGGEGEEEGGKEG
ncbi:hypothetical protein NFI96_006927 [Prochilodus magdalenae]|nr:hypothetical protein NFI96_006927 [Prochilodus magdalenae]